MFLNGVLLCTARDENQIENFDIRRFQFESFRFEIDFSNLNFENLNSEFFENFWIGIEIIYKIIENSKFWSDLFPILIQFFSDYIRISKL